MIVAALNVLLCDGDEAEEMRWIAGYNLFSRWWMIEDRVALFISFYIK